MREYPKAATERAMKVQEVILRAMAKKLTWWQAAEIIGISDRQMRRWRQRYQEYGYDGLYDRRRGKPSPKRVPVEMVEQVLGLYREKYFDFNVRHFHEKLREEHGIPLSYTWVKLALQGAGLVKKSRRRGVHRRRRPRRPLPGMLLHIDASPHRWLSQENWHDLLTIQDDATGEVYYGQLVEEESTRTVLEALREVVEQRGVFCALYSDRASHFFVTPKAGEPVDRNRVTQVGRAMRELGIELIPAYSPQARGAQRAGVPDLAGAPAAGAAPAGDSDPAGSQWLLAGDLPGGVQPAVHGAGRPAGQCVCAGAAAGPGSDLLHPTETSRESG